jgi:hypothetical protein
VLSTLEDKKRVGLPDVVEGDAVVQEPKK